MSSGEYPGPIGLLPPTVIYGVGVNVPSGREYEVVAGVYRGRARKMTSARASRRESGPSPARTAASPSAQKASTTETVRVHARRVWLIGVPQGCGWNATV